MIVVTTGTLGYVVGYLFALVWNGLVAGSALIEDDGGKGRAHRRASRRA